MRWRGALHREVVNTSTAEASGRLDGMVFEPTSSSIVALVVGDKVVGWNDTGGIGPDAVTVTDASMLRDPETDLERAGVAGLTDPIAKPVFTEDGFEIGTVGDLELDETTGTVRQLLLGDDQINGSRIIGVGSFAVVVSSTGKATATGDLDGLTKSELYDLARDRDLDGRSTMSKAELVDALRS